MTSPNKRDLELLDMPSIASQMPVVFANGAQWEGLQCECQGCNRVLPENDVRGAVIKQSEHMVAIEASGVCVGCNLLTRFVYRLYDDMRITGPRESGWQTWGGKKPSLLQRIRQFIRMRCSRDSSD